MRAANVEIRVLRGSARAAGDQQKLRYFPLRKSRIVFLPSALG
jgi:hypothetical protein